MWPALIDCKLSGKNIPGGMIEIYAANRNSRDFRKITERIYTLSALYTYTYRSRNNSRTDLMPAITSYIYIYIYHAATSIRPPELIFFPKESLANSNKFLFGNNTL